MNGATIVKIVIVLVVFPVAALAIFTVVTVPLGLMLTPAFARAGSWEEVLAKVFVGATFLFAVLGSLAVCRRVWPRGRPSSHEEEL